MKNDRVAKIARYWPIVENGGRLSPISIQVALTDSCFNRCIGCGHPSRVQNKMSVGDWINFLESLPELPESVCYSGGDPMAYPDFNDVMIWHSESKVKFGCTITGYVPPTIDLELLSKSEWVRVSLDAIDEDVYAKVRGKTPLSKVLESIDDMLVVNVNVELGITLHQENEHQLPKIIEWAAGKGICKDKISTRYAYPKSNPLWQDADMGQRGVQKFNNCKAVLYQLYIDSDGSVYPCCVTAGDTRSKSQSLALGNIFVDKWAKIWADVIQYSDKNIADLPEICRTCCVQRLSEINNVCDSLSTTKSFF